MLGCSYPENSRTTDHRLQGIGKQVWSEIASVLLLACLRDPDPTCPDSLADPHVVCSLWSVVRKGVYLTDTSSPSMSNTTFTLDLRLPELRT